jgi:ABC-type Mn2+/Zn2+ transport system permease subunit
MFEHCWLILLRGRMLRRLGPIYGLEIVSHRVLRYGSGILHVVLLGSSIALFASGWFYDLVLACQLGLLLAALAGVGIARYYVLVSWATLVALVNYLRRGVPAGWEPVRE